MIFMGVTGGSALGVSIGTSEIELSSISTALLQQQAVGTGNIALSSISTALMQLSSVSPAILTVPYARLDSSSSLIYLHKIDSFTPRNEDNAEFSGVQSSWAQIKRLRFPLGIGGTVRVMLDMKNPGGELTETRVSGPGGYIGNPFSTTSTAYLTFSSTSTFPLSAPNASFSVDFRVPSGASAGYVKNFKICYDNAPDIVKLDTTEAS